MAGVRTTPIVGSIGDPATSWALVLRWLITSMDAIKARNERVQSADTCQRCCRGSGVVVVRIEGGFGGPEQKPQLRSHHSDNRAVQALAKECGRDMRARVRGGGVIGVKLQSRRYSREDVVVELMINRSSCLLGTTVLSDVHDVIQDRMQVWLHEQCQVRGCR